MSVWKSAAAVLVGGAIVADGVFASKTMRAGQPPENPRGPDGPPAQTVPDGPRSPAGSLFAIRIAADPKHDGDAARPEYQWVKAAPGAASPIDGLVTRKEGEDLLVALKPDAQKLTERDLQEVKKARVERDASAIEFRLTPDAARRLGILTRAHLPEDGGLFRYRVALVVEARIVTLPFLFSEIRESGVVEFSPPMPPKEFDRIVELLAEAAAYNNPPTARAVTDRAAAVSEARAVDLPALAAADRIVIEPIPRGYRMEVRAPGDVTAFVQALRPTEAPAEGSGLKAILWFYRGDDLLRKVWVREGGEWGFERPGESWTTGADHDLWRFVGERLGIKKSAWRRVVESAFQRFAWAVETDQNTVQG